MKQIVDMLAENRRVSDYKFNITRKESYELFFVKGKLETVRRTDTTDREVTVYVDHDGYKGDAQFFIYPATTLDEVAVRIEDAVEKALLINNENYTLPSAEQGKFEVESNFTDYAVPDLAAKLAQAVFAANTMENAGLNSVEIFINKYTEKVFNSRDLCKTQIRYNAMIEAIPTYNGDTQSVELYEQYNFSSFDAAAITAEIAGKLEEVRARYAAKKPESELDCPIVIGGEEIDTLFANIADNFNYSTVYSHSNIFSKGDAIQKDPTGDRISISLAGEVDGCVGSMKFDIDGLALTDRQIVKDGVAINYYGVNRFAQYLGETPTGALRCLCVAPGTADAQAIGGKYLEIVSMSGLQVDFYNDYIGGEVRLAYYHDGDSVTPITGISISGALSNALNSIRLSKQTTVRDNYAGPAKAILNGMKIF